MAKAKAFEGPDVAPPWQAPDRPIRCAIIGAGARGSSFAKRLQGLEGVQLRWLADLSQDRLNACKDRLSDPRPSLTTTPDEAIADPQVDAVFITVPDYLHRAPAVAAFEAGKHVFVEKPLATTLGDARAILAAWHRCCSVSHVSLLMDPPDPAGARNPIACAPGQARR
jgi:hypothetical protein